MQGGKLAAQYDKESKGERNLAFKPVSHTCLPQLAYTHDVEAGASVTSISALGGLLSSYMLAEDPTFGHMPRGCTAGLGHLALREPELWPLSACLMQDRAPTDARVVARASHLHCLTQYSLTMKI